MSGEKLAAGDVVKLKSGGQALTIEWTDDDGAQCTWFDKTDLKNAYIKKNALAKFTPQERASFSEIGEKLG